MRRLLQFIIGAGGAAVVLIGLAHIAFGTAAIPGAIPVNATLDSEDRCFAAIFAAYGLALLWCVKDIERKSQFVYFLAFAIFAGGLARLVSMAMVGLPHPFYLAMTALELLLPPAVGYMQMRIARA